MGDHAFRYTDETGLVQLPELPGDVTSRATGVSANGLVIAGWSADASGAGGVQTATGAHSAVIWNAGILKKLPYVPNLSFGIFKGTVAFGISRDGNVVVGRADYSLTTRPIRWVITGDVDGQDLGVLGAEDSGSFGEALAANLDGGTIVGSASSDQSWRALLAYPSGSIVLYLGITYECVTGPSSVGVPPNADSAWITPATGYLSDVQMPCYWAGPGYGTTDISPPGFTFGSAGEAFAITSHLPVIVGSENFPGSSVETASLWDSVDGMANFGLLPGVFSGNATFYGISDAYNNSVGAGTGTDAHTHAFIRRPVGVGTLQLLPELAGTTVSLARAISDDARVAVGVCDTGVEKAVRWKGIVADTDTPTVFFLGFMPGGTYSDAMAVTSDGTVIVGYGDAGPSSGGGGSSMFPVLPTKDFDPPAFDTLAMITAVNSVAPYWVERFTKMFDVSDPLVAGWFLDGAVTPTAMIDQGTGAKLYGLWHLRGQTGISVVINELDCGGNYTVATDGTLFVPYFSDPDGLFGPDDLVGPGIVGFAYLSQGQILRPGSAQEAGAANGPPLGKVRRGHQYAALMVNAVAGTVAFGTTFTTARVAQFKTPGGTPYTKEQLFSGVHWDTLDDTYGFDSQLCWQITRPYPCTVASIGSFLSTQDR